MRDNHKYDDIINMPHHVSTTHPQMPLHDRAAQFSPFAALTGHEDAIKETARLTDEWMEPDDDRKSELNGKLQELLARIGEKPPVTVTYFIPDEQKAGGTYVTVTGKLKKINEYDRMLVLEDGLTIACDRICDIEN